ncbi:toll/interleukin-1 receptor domain-containing protein [Luteibacter jiangsuensis]|uniref:Toll/interleukin-1 receptor domain-containing protein n=1 Tax=Luteibacter jiangsuensis TaxID=637577 RepID=A0ABX0Q5R1_9GAMM|nr:toll/interleukin-1 receptor domain-containing protein [Luteibacter jiangsuensis]NID05875.1 toll/interleukin-1 receptor domain-containing protein [Luteibacter jiangsuensis]
MASAFFSYSHTDEQLRNELEVHLAMLKREGIIDTWHDRRIVAGENIDRAIDERINWDDIILLLVSPSFLDSAYCFDIELKRAMERHETGEAVVIPVILRPCDWTRAPFGKLLALPTDGRPVTRWPDKDEAYLDIAQGIRRAAEHIGRDKVRPAPSPTLAAPRPSEPSQTIGSTGVTPAAETTRSSNLRLAKTFTQREKDQFTEEAFRYIALYFQNSLAELGKRDAGFEGVFRDIDNGRFTASIYHNGDAVARCTVYEGGPFGGGIYYAQGENRGNNSYNESLSVDADDQTLFLRSLGMSSMGHGHVQKLSLEGAAELFWSLLIGPLQGRR